MKKQGNPPVVYAVMAIITLALVIFIRLRLATAPLGRDEGEYAYSGRLALQGNPPYLPAYNMKFPGTSSLLIACSLKRLPNPVVIL